MSWTLSWALSCSKDCLSPKFLLKRILFQNFSIKLDVLSFCKEIFWYKLSKSKFVLDLVLDSVLDQRFSKSEMFFYTEFFFHNFSTILDILRLFAKKKFWLKFCQSNFVLDSVLDQRFSKSKFYFKGIFFTISPPYMTF